MRIGKEAAQGAEGGERVEVTIKGEPKEIAVLLLEVVGRQECGLSEAIASLAAVNGTLQNSIRQDLAEQLSRLQGQTKIDEHTVMGINSKTFEATMLLLHDLSAWFKGERYTIAIEVEPDGVLVKKYPKE